MSFFKWNILRFATHRFPYPIKIATLKNSFHIGLLILTLCIFASQVNAQSDLYYCKTAIGQQVPDFTFKSVDGKTYTMKDLRGKVVWLNFFSTSCPPCRKEIPHLKRVASQYKGKDLVIIGIGREHTAREMFFFKRSANLNYMLSADPKDDIFALFANTSIPRNYIIDQNGIIISQEVGYTTKRFERLKEAVKSRLP